MFTIENDHKIMKILGVSELRHLICHTNLGELTMMIRKGETQYTFVLDAVPVGSEQNKELTTLLRQFSVEVQMRPKTDVPQVQKTYSPQIDIATNKSIPLKEIRKTVLKQVKLVTKKK
jgi:hypothetical protein